MISKGPRSYSCTQVPCLAVKKWNRIILTEIDNFFVNASYQLSEKNTPYFCWRLLWWKMGQKGHIFEFVKEEASLWPQLTMAWIQPAWIWPKNIYIIETCAVMSSSLSWVLHSRQILFTFIKHFCKKRPTTCMCSYTSTLHVHDLVQPPFFTWMYTVNFVYNEAQGTIDPKSL